MTTVRRVGIAGLVLMAVVAVATLLWPHVATVVFGVLLAALSTVATVPVVTAARWVRAEMASRRELRAMPALDVPAYSVPSVATPTLHELRMSA